MNLPSRGERESATTTRYTGFFFDPTRVNLIRTAKSLPPCLRSLLAFVGLRRFALRLLRGAGHLGELPSADALHQLFHLLASFEQAVDLFDAGAGATRDALTARPVDHLRQRALLGRHREDDRLDARELLLVDVVEPLELLAEARDQLHQTADRAHAPDHPVTLEKVVEAELPLEHAGLELLLLVLLDGLLGAFDQRQDVAHAEDARSHPIGVEVLELVDLLADRDELDRPAGDGLDRERGTAARVAVELRQDHAVKGDALLEGERDVDGFLAGHRVEHEQHIGRLRRVANALKLLHQLLVHVQAARRVEDDRVRTVRGKPLDTVAHDADGIGTVLAVHRHLDLAAKLLELVDRGGSLEVRRGERRCPSFLAQPQCELGRGGGLAGALQAGEQDHRRRAPGEDQLRAACAHQLRQLLVHGLHDLLARRDALQDLLTERALTHLRDEVLDDLEVDVRLEQREPDLAHRARDRLLVEAAAPGRSPSAVWSLSESVSNTSPRSVLTAFRGVSPPGFITERSGDGRRREG